MSNIIDFSCGGYHVVALSKEGDLYCWGHNGQGQLGSGDVNQIYVPKPTKVGFCFPAKIVKISCGRNHSMVILSDGSLFCWGDNSYGQLGVGNVEVGCLNVPTQVKEIESQIIQVKCGSTHSMAITSRNELFSWGGNRYGQLGNGKSKNSQPNPQKIDILSEGLMYFDLEFEEMIKNWPSTHNIFSASNQKTLQIVLLILQLKNISKDISIYYCQIFLKIQHLSN
eukprot:TRINITY_DN8862_c0_g2_i1.p1 TRINITY_DN8862_c0_g2~~TRINITY_DN8862_c0_g2_i1.p1  ORF type:complete len:245 (-),score=69.91 TRINITY_DN8862_c0_g2_i1:100-774(-)